MQSNYPPQGNVPPPYGGQPSYQTPMQQGYAQPMPPVPPQTPVKKRKPWLWIIALIVMFFAGYGIGSAGHATTTTTTATTTQTVPTQAAPTVAPTSAPAKATTAPKPSAPTVLFQQSGNGELTTKSFNAPASWTLSWSCTPDASGIDAPIYINVLDSTGTDTFNGDISATCKTGNTSGSSQESQSGTVSLHIISGIDWTVKAVTA